MKIRPLLAAHLRKTPPTPSPRAVHTREANKAELHQNTPPPWCARTWLQAPELSSGTANCIRALSLLRGRPNCGCVRK